MVLRRLLGRLRLRRMERRGEAVVDNGLYFDGFATLADDLIPGRDFEILRDLLRILAFCWAARADRSKTHHPYFGELCEKHGTYLFLPVVSRIERHQAGPLPATLQLDAIMDAFGNISSAAVVRQAFALAPKAGRERNAFFLALLTRSWGRDHVFDTPNEFYEAVAAQLRLLIRTT